MTILESSINITRTKSTFGEIRALGIIEKLGWAAEEEEAGQRPHSSSDVPTYYLHTLHTGVTADSSAM